MGEELFLGPNSDHGMKMRPGSDVVPHGSIYSDISNGNYSPEGSYSGSITSRKSERTEPKSRKTNRHRRAGSLTSVESSVYSDTQAKTDVKQNKKKSLQRSMTEMLSHRRTHSQASHRSERPKDTRKLQMNKIKRNSPAHSTISHNSKL